MKEISAIKLTLKKSKGTLLSEKKFLKQLHAGPLPSNVFDKFTKVDVSSVWGKVNGIVLVKACPRLTLIAAGKALLSSARERSMTHLLSWAI